MAEGSVLIIDDEYGVRSGIRTILEMEGYAVREAETGAAAMLALEHGPVDIVLLDYRLPDSDGLSLLEPIKSLDADAMVCMITAYANIDTAVAATRQGVDFFLPKPFNPDDLLGVIETLLRHKAARSEAARLRAENEAGLLALAEEKTQTHSLVSSLRDAVLVVNRVGDVALANAAMMGLLGRPEDEVLMRPARSLLEGGALAPLTERLDAPMKDRTVTELDIDERTFMASVVTFRGDDGSALGRILTLSDVSELRRAAMDKGRFIRMMVHELRSPMGSVKSVLEVLLDHSLGDGIEPYLSMVARADARIDGLTELVGGLLDLSRIEQRRGAEEPTLVAVGPAVTQALEVLRETMTARGISAAVEIAAELPPVLIGADDLALVLGNLVGNAVKYNRDGGRVTVRGAVADGWVRLDVVDTGVGIKAENLDKVFAEFFREKRRETRELEGNGLGLAIVKRLVDQAGGRLEVVSVEGEGSTFSVLLPA